MHQFCQEISFRKYQFAHIHEYTHTHTRVCLCPIQYPVKYNYYYIFPAKKRHLGDTTIKSHQKKNKYDPTQIKNVTELQEYLIEVEQADKCMFTN